MAGIDYETVEVALNSIHKTMPDFYGFVGYSRQSSNNYKAMGHIPVKFAPKIAKFFGVSIDSVMSNKIFDAINEKKPATIQLSRDFIEIRMIDAGAGSEAFYNESGLEFVSIHKDLIPKNTIINDNTFIVRVIGDSMEPTFNENDIVFVDMLLGRSVVQGDGVYLVRYGNAIQLKQIQFIGNGHINLISINQTYPIINTKDEEVEWEILGKPFVKWGVQYFAKLEIKR
jgi:hypothetical protein